MIPRHSARMRLVCVWPPLQRHALLSFLWQRACAPWCVFGRRFGTPASFKRACAPGVCSAAALARPCQPPARLRTEVLFGCRFGTPYVIPARLRLVSFGCRFGGRPRHSSACAPAVVSAAALARPRHSCALRAVSCSRRLGTPASFQRTRAGDCSAAALARPRHSCPHPRQVSLELPRHALSRSVAHARLVLLELPWRALRHSCAHARLLLVRPLWHGAARRGAVPLHPQGRQPPRTARTWRNRSPVRRPAVARTLAL